VTIRIAQRTRGGFAFWSALRTGELAAKAGSGECQSGTFQLWTRRTASAAPFLMWRRRSVILKAMTKRRSSAAAPAEYSPGTFATAAQADVR
jgi:hypothetical protein